MAPTSPQRPVITFLSDYGHHDEFVGVCHGVIARRAVGPHARRAVAEPGDTLTVEHAGVRRPA